MSLGGISGYGQPGNISIPEDYSYTPYLPYAQQGPYDAIMSQMGNYGTGAGNVYGGAVSGGAGGYNPDLYKRVAATAPLVPAVIDSTTRGGGGGGGRTSFEPGAGFAQFGGSGFSPEVSPYANRLAAFLGNLGFTGISDAIAKNVNTNYGNEGKNAPPSVVGNTDYSNEGRNYFALAPTQEVGDVGFNPISGYSVGPAVSTPAPAPAPTPAVIDGGFNPISGYSVGPAVSTPAPAPTPVSSTFDGWGGEFGSWGGEERGSRGGGGGGGGDGGGGAATGGRDGDASGGGDRGTRGGFAKGGHVNASLLSGPDPMGPDQGYGALKGGEYVINDKAVKKYGIELMDAINSGKISKGKLRGLLEM